jgi:hypothetical protein
MGDAYTIADIAIFPWVRNLIERYQAGDLVGIQDFPQSRARWRRLWHGRRCCAGWRSRAAPDLIAAYASSTAARDRFGTNLYPTHRKVRFNLRRPSRACSPSASALTPW